MRSRPFILALVISAVLAVGLAAPAFAGEEAAESQFVSLTNGERSRALSVDSELTSIARRWSAKMAADNRLSHNPNLSSEVTQDWKKLGENVGVGGDAPQIHAAFMNSPPHRANIVDPDFTRIGVGVVRGGDGRIWVTEVFMRLRSDDAPPPSGGGSSPPTTAAPTPPGSPSPSPSPSPGPAPAAGPRATTPAPATTARPRTTTTRPPGPATTPPATASPASSATTTPPPAEAAAPSGVTGQTAAPLSTEPSSRLVLVLGQLVALDQGR